MNAKQRRVARREAERIDKHNALVLGDEDDRWWSDDDDREEDVDGDELGCWEGDSFRRGLCVDDICRNSHRCLSKPFPREAW